MSRGLGAAQRAILDKLEQAGGRAFITDLCEDVPGVELRNGTFDHDLARVNERARVRAAVRGLERRGLVRCRRLTNYDRDPVECKITIAVDLGPLGGLSIEPIEYTRSASETLVILAAATTERSFKFS